MATAARHKTNGVNAPPSRRKPSVLHERSLNYLDIDTRFSIDRLTEELEHFHLHSPSKENICDKSADPLQQPETRPGQANPSFAVTANAGGPGRPALVSTAHDPPRVPVHELATNEEQLAKHTAGQFDWILEVPTSTGLAKGHSARLSRDLHMAQRARDGTKLYFGCNLLRRQRPSADGSRHVHSANTYTLIATRLDLAGLCGRDSTRADAADTMAATTEVLDVDTSASTIVRMTSVPPDTSPQAQRISVTALAGKHDDIVEQIIALPLAKSASRIEDSVEALDRLVDDLEALDTIAKTGLVVSPDALKTPQASMNAALAQTDSAGKRASLKTGAKTVRAKATVGRALLVRQSTSTTLAKDGEKESWTSPGPRKRTAPAPPASLLPPKPLAKSNRPPIKPTFELPGEAVARRLKEQREARLSQPISADEAAAVAAKYSPSKPHAKSTKVPTRPTFELPGEAISRRKREEHEAKLRAQEEEDRKRREFKARPVRTSIAPSTFPRGTIASRARQGKVQAEGSEAAAAAVAATSFTRLSIATTSSSTGGEPRSTVSAEEAQQQKQRGRAVFSRDNSYAANRERERRQREAAAKQARQDAAERSRRLSREWAEKQRLRKLAAAGGEAS